MNDIHHAERIPVSAASTSPRTSTWPASSIATASSIVRSQSFTNDAEGFQRILDRLKEVGGPAKVAIAMEATGHYWYSLHDFLARHRYHVVVLNPIQTAKQVKKGIRKSKTDKIDAHHIAVLLKNGEHRPGPGPRRIGHDLPATDAAAVHHGPSSIAGIKQLLWSKLASGLAGVRDTLRHALLQDRTDAAEHGTHAAGRAGPGHARNWPS